MQNLGSVMTGWVDSLSSNEGFKLFMGGEAAAAAAAAAVNPASCRIRSRQLVC
jgi:hypothetical protein